MLRQGPEDSKGRSPAGLGLHSDAPLLSAHESEDNRQTKPASGEFRGEERIKELVEVFRLNPAPRVGDLQTGISIRLRFPAHGKRRAG